MTRKVPLPRRLFVLRNNRDGSAMVELAFILPLLLFLLFGLLEFGGLIYQQHVVTKGVQEAARYAARNPAIVETPNCPPSSAGWPNVVSSAKNIATRGEPGTTQDLILPKFTAATVTVTVECASEPALISANPLSGSLPIVRVTASVSPSSLGFLGFIDPQTFQITAEHEEMAIGL